MTQIITNNGGGGSGVGVYKYKGSVNSYEDLPSSGMKIGDVYNVVNEHTTAPVFPAGTNVAWTGTDWDALGGSIDLSEYQKKLVEGDGIDLDQDTNEISVESTVISGAALGATAIQPNDNVSELANDAGYIDKDVNDLTNYTKTSDLPDFTTYQLKSNMVTSLNSADNDHYPTAKAVKDAISSAGGGDVSGPSSSVDGHLAVFDGTTGKIIKDGGAIPTPTTVVDDLSTQSSTSALSANQGYVLKGYIDTINGKIPSEASSSNKLADKNYVDDSINQVAAYYITKNASGAAFATKAELLATTTFYSGGTTRVPTRNDYCIVLADETHNGETTRYSYQGSSWEYQYTVNETALTQQQVDALNSGITSTKVGQYDTAVSTISGYGNIVTHNTSEFATATQGGKADTALQPNDNISKLNNDTGYITGVNWGSVGGTLSNQVDLQNALNAKANDSAVVHNTGAETIAGTKTFSTSPVVPSKTADATNTGTAIATEAQVYKKQDTLVSGTNIKTVNGESILGSGNISISAPSYTAGNGIDITSDEIGLDGTYSAVENDMKGPCLIGFHVPTKSEFQSIINAGIAIGVWTSSGGDNLKTYLKLPFAGNRSNTNGSESGQGSSAAIWLCSTNGNDVDNLYVTSSQISFFANSYTCSGKSIRPIKDIASIPDSSWTVLYQGAGSAGIYHKSTLGLISISSDGATWITIADKNLGATTVYNSGDALSEANCGKFYQRGNNYGFPFTGSITTSGTQVNASTYGPGNYYNSSTYITQAGGTRWDSSNNNNLWGRTSQGTHTGPSGNLIIGDNLYKIVKSAAAPSGADGNTITLVV